MYNVVVSKQTKTEHESGKTKTVHYSYLDLGYRKLFLPFGDSSIVTNAELLQITVQDYLALSDGEYTCPLERNKINKKE